MIPSTHFHPIVVHFAVALIIVGFLTELAAHFFKKETWIAKAGFYLMIVAALSAGLAYLTGEMFTEQKTGIEGEIYEIHDLFANITMNTMFANAGFRILLRILKKDETRFRWLIIAVYGISAVMVSIAGYYGGSLVYDYMIKP